METKINGFSYIGQYADKYYLLHVDFYNAIFTIYDATKRRIVKRKVRNHSVKINNQTINTVWFVN